MLQVVSPRIWFPSMQIVWGVLTFGYATLYTLQLTVPVDGVNSTSAVNNVRQVMIFIYQSVFACF